MSQCFLKNILFIFLDRRKRVAVGARGAFTLGHVFGNMPSHFMAKPPLCGGEEETEKW